MDESNGRDRIETNDGNAEIAQKQTSKIAFATTSLLILAIIYTLYFAKALLLPIVIAVLLNFLFAPVMRVLIRIHIPRLLAALLIILVVFFVIFLGFYRLSAPVSEWLTDAPANFSQATQKINQLTLPISQSMQRLFKIQEQIEKTTHIAAEKNVPIVNIKPGWFNIIFTNTWEFFIELGMVVIFLYFLLASHDFILYKLIRLLPYYSEKKEAVIIIRQIEQKISYFLFIKIITSIGLAIVIALAMFLLQMPHPLVWGILAGFLEFIPYIGVLIGTTAVTFSSLLIFDSFSHILLVPVVFFAICSIEGNFVLPIVLNRGLILHPLIILLGVIVFGWIWGVVGALIAIPLISIFKIICDNVKPLNLYGELLGTENIS
ncbi:MAG TPA: AI-2E family transporter [Gammaproteobacteria bacterium]|nr:AI-2E family transporter [Gammaproteobacteria bacterium]